MRKKMPKNGGSNTTLSDALSKISELTGIAAAQELIITQLQESLSEKDKEINHLKCLLDKQVPTLNDPFANIKLDDVTIAEIQIERLGKSAIERELTNEEARRFEIFSKVIQNAQKNEAPSKNDKILRDVTPKQLISIAKCKIKAIDDE